MSTETVSTINRGIEPITWEFLEKVNAGRGPQIYEMSVDEARNTLSTVQEIDVFKKPVDVEDMAIPGGPKSQVRIRIIRPHGSIGTLPAVMYFHGGGWVLGDYRVFERLLGDLAHGANAAIVYVDYTRSPEAKYPIAIEEDYTATKYVADNGKDLGLDTSRLAIAGDSVGGNMTAVVSMLAKQRGGPRIDYQVLFYPVTDANFNNASYSQFATGHWLTKEAMKWFWDNYLPDPQERRNSMASPLQATVDQLKGLPPALVITNEYDVLRDEGEAYAHKLMEAGVKTTGVRFLGTIHDMVMLNALANTPSAQGAIELASDMLRKAFVKK